MNDADPVPDADPVTAADPVTGARDDESPAGPVRYRMRRAPRYRAFGLTGVVIGLVIGLVLAYSRAAGGDYSQQTIAGYFAASFGLLGALIGLGVAVLADRRGR